MINTLADREARKKPDVFVGREDRDLSEMDIKDFIGRKDALVARNVSDVSLGADQDFDFSMSLRNVAMVESGHPVPRIHKTGTTIVGCIFKDGVIIGGDKRSTMGNIVANKSSHKVEKLTENIWLGGAGTAADLYKVRSMISANLRLHELNTGNPARVVMAISLLRDHLFKYQGHVGAYLVVGGIDATGIHLFTCSAGGFTIRQSFTAEGSGSYIATSVLESGFTLDMTEDAAVALIQNALQQAMMGDNASGNAYDIVVVKKDGHRFMGPFYPDFARRPELPIRDYVPKRGTAVILKEKTIRYDVIEEINEKRDKEVEIVAREVAAMEVE